MSVRALLYGGVFIMLLSVLLVIGCTKRSPYPPDSSDSQTTEEPAVSASVQNETEALTAQRERERQTAIE